MATLRAVGGNSTLHFSALLGAEVFGINTVQQSPTNRRLETHFRSIACREAPSLWLTVSSKMGMKSRLLGEDEVPHSRPVGEDPRPLSVKVALHLAEVFRGEDNSDNFLEHLYEQRTPVTPHSLDSLANRIKGSGSVGGLRP